MLLLHGNMMSNAYRGLFALAVSAFLATFGLSTARAEAPPTFNRDIRPLLSDRCYACHGPDSASRAAELRLDTAEGAHEWAIVAGDAASSEVIARISSDDPTMRMPPADSNKPPLTPEEIELIRRWIDGGAEYEGHWAYIPPTRPEVPAAVEFPGEAASGGVTNPIDRFLRARIAASALTPSPEADRVTLARRLYLDLTGLPPTPAQIDEFLADSEPEAYERLVERLIDSPEYGERMATWWFDLVRFATTVGYHGDQEHRITPYRDYVIKSFNDNLPFDQFTIEQLAGDLLPEPTMWQRIASGYNRLLQTTHEGGAQDAEYRAKHLADRVRNYSETWLAGSMGCAECHDHKFDPYTQKDFYRMGAFFADVDHYGSFVPIGSNSTPTERPPEMLAWTLPIFEQMQEIDAEIAELEKSLTGLIKRGWEERQKKLTELKKQRVELEGQFVPTMITQAIEPRETRVLPRGNWLDPTGEVVQPGVPEFLDQVDSGDRRATRLDLAKWTVARENPLTARVVMNRLWKIFYGVGISKTLVDLGSQSEPPVNQDLLDWLAIDFMESGWDLKHMVRQMVTSRAYRQSSRPRPEIEKVDPDNRLVARQSRFRLEAEQIRDGALAVSGLLVRKIGGDIARPYQPAGYYAALNFPEREYVASTGPNQFRRGVYTHWQRQFLHPWLLAFDAPTREECTALRPISNTPTAALVLLNDPSFIEAARGLAARVLTECGPDAAPQAEAPAANDAESNSPAPEKSSPEKGATDEERIRWAWRQVLGRDARSEEVDRLGALLEKHRAQYRADPVAAQEFVAVGISPVPENLDLAELAAWTSVSRVLLNLDETISRN